MITNSLKLDAALDDGPWIDGTELEVYLKHKNPTFYLWVVFHELLGHGTGKLLTEESPGKYNFDIENPPISPLTGQPITSWYRYGQTWTGLFADIATTIDECRAECVGAYLMSEMDLFAIFGYAEDTPITGLDCNSIQSPTLSTE